ncbi:MAG: hypothetical protein ACRD1K_00375 [Acidimicrobiales bacterium]
MARRKLVDHLRRVEREARSLIVVAGGRGPSPGVEPGDQLASSPPAAALLGTHLAVP